MRYPVGVLGGRETVETRVLLAYDDQYRTHREVIAAGIQVLRPHVVVASCPLDELVQELERFDPQVVICGRPTTADPGDRPAAWVELPLEPERPAQVRVGGSRRESGYLLLEGLLGIIDEAEELIRTNADRAGSWGPLGWARSGDHRRRTAGDLEGRATRPRGAK